MRTNNLKNNLGQNFSGVNIIYPNIFEDDRGYFYESFNKNVFNKQFGEINFVQENHSFSKESVLRGLHFQVPPYGQGKLVKCISGSIIDVVVDLRKKSKTFLTWGSIELSENNHKQLWIEKGFAHGFYTKSKSAHLIYKIDNYWNKNAERSIIWNDPSIGIIWPLTTNSPIISQKDLIGMRIDQFDNEELF